LFGSSCRYGHGATTRAWQFDSYDLYRAKKAITLQKDLEINMIGIGIILDLLDEIKELKQEIDLKL
jgi:chaperone modulatory protein CbpM